MFIFRVRSGLTKGGVLLAVVLGLANGIYFWKPVFDPADKDRMLKYARPDTAGTSRVRDARIPFF